MQKRHSPDPSRQTPHPRTFFPPSTSHEESTDLSLGALLLVGDTSSSDALDDVLTVLVELELGDLDLGRSDADWDGLAVGLLAGNTLDVDDVFETVDGGDLSLTTLVGATLDDNLVVLADGDGTDVVLLTEFLGERSAHDHAAHAGRRREVSLAALSPAGRQVGVDLRHFGGGFWLLLVLKSVGGAKKPSGRRQANLKFEVHSGVSWSLGNRSRILGLSRY